MHNSQKPTSAIRWAKPSKYRFNLGLSPSLRLGLVSLVTILAWPFSLLPPPQVVQAAVPAGYSEYYIPGESDQLWNIFENLDDDPVLDEAQGIHSVIAVTASSDNTTIYYDHWENGYGFDPTQPGTTADEIRYSNQGDVQEFESSNIPVRPRGTSVYSCTNSSHPITSTICYDGRDRIYVAGGAPTVTRAGWPESIGTVFALAWEIYPTKPFLDRYTVPVGEDLAPGYDDFDRVYVIVQSTTNTTTVYIDDPTTGPSPDINVTLNQGEVTQLWSINAGTTVTATEPVQVQFIVGQAQSGAYSEIRGFSAVPDSLWDTEYYNPVDGSGAYNTDIYLYNPQSVTITVNYEDKSGSGSFTIPANGTLSYSDGAGRTVPNGSGVYLSSDYKFWGIGSGGTENADYDWGYSLVPAYVLTEEYFLGWAPGTRDLTANGSPVYITPVQDDTTVYVDYSPTDGVVDVTYNLNRLDSQTIFDPDDENSGMHIWATGPIALAWGEDPDAPEIAITDPYLDLGYTTLPLPEAWMDVILVMTKTVEPSTLPPGAGQVATYTLAIPVHEMDSGAAFTMTNMVVSDTLPSGWQYITNTTTITLPDNSVITGTAANPTVTGQDLLWDNQLPIMKPNDLVIIIFGVRTTAAVPLGYNENNAQVTGMITQTDSTTQTFTACDDASVYITPLTIDKDTSTPSVEVGGVATYTIVLNNAGNTPVTNVVVSDTLPAAGFTYADSSVTESNVVTRTSTTTPTLGDNTLVWGTWDIGPGGAVTITFSANVAITTTAGAYDNTASASSTETGPVDDAGTAGQDSHTPSGKDPEDDEDVTVTLPVRGLEIIKTLVTSSPVVVGEAVQFQIVVVNTGTTSLVTVPLTDTFDTAYLAFNNAITSPDSTSAGELVWNNVGPIAIGGRVTITVNFTATAAVANTLNWAYASAEDENGDDVPEESDSATVEITDPGLEIIKTRTSPSLVVVGEAVQFQIVVVNTGTTSLVTVPLTDTYNSSYLTFNNAITSPDSTSAGELVWNNVGPIAVGGRVTITVNFTATAAVVNTLNWAYASAEDENGDDVPEESDSATVEIADPGLEIIKTRTSPSPVVVGEAVQFQIVVVNTGTTSLVTVPLTDTFDTAYLAFNNAITSPDSTSAGELVWNNVGPIAVGGRVTITVNFTATAAVASTLNWAYASAEDENGDDVPEESDSATVEITDPGLEIIKTRTSPSPVVVGEAVQFQIVVVNTGTTSLVTVPLTDTYNSSYLAFNNASQPPNSTPANQLIWNDVGPIPVGGRVTITVNFTATAAVVSTTNYAAASAMDENGDDVPEEQASATVEITDPGLEIIKTRTSPSPVVVGEAVQFQIVVVNTGTTSLVTVPLTDTFDTAYLAFNNADTPPDSTVPAGQLTWNNIGAILVGGRVTITVNFTATAAVASTTNYAAASAEDENGDEVPEESDSAPVSITDPGLEITKSRTSASPVVVGEAVQFQIVVVNTGTTSLTTVPLTDTYDSTYLTFNNASQPPDSTPANQLIWNDVGPIAVGGRVTITVNFTATAAVASTMNTAVASATDSNGDEVPEDNDSDTVEITEPVPGLEVVKAVAPDEVVPNMPFTYTIRINNTGEVTFTAMAISDTLPPDFYYISGTGVPTDPDIIAEPLLVWFDLVPLVGPLAPGDSLTVTFAVTVTPGITGTYWNTVTATGTTPGDVLTETGDIPVDIEEPAVEIDKRVVAIDRDNVLPQRNLITFTIAITNVGPSPIGELSLEDQYDPWYLGFEDATPYPDDVTAGLLTWNDLTGPAPNGFDRDLPPGEAFFVTTVFYVNHDINITTTNVATVTDVVDTYDNPVDDDDDEEDIGGEDGGIPTPVELLYFRAVAGEAKVRLEWATAAEVGVVGFYVYRAQDASLDNAQVMAYVPATGSGSTYSYVDWDVTPDQTYWYWLAEVSTAGSETLYGPVQGGVGTDSLPYRLYLPLVLSNAEGLVLSADVSSEAEGLGNTEGLIQDEQVEQSAASFDYARPEPVEGQSRRAQDSPQGNRIYAQTSPQAVILRSEATKNLVCKKAFLYGKERDSSPPLRSGSE